jgi:hypothetical protein
MNVRRERTIEMGKHEGKVAVITAAANADRYDAQLQLAQTQEQEAISLMQIHAALNGGWQ